LLSFFFFFFFLSQAATWIKGRTIEEVTVTFNLPPFGQAEEVEVYDENQRLKTFTRTTSS
jgi:hypothetical protein